MQNITSLMFSVDTPIFRRVKLVIKLFLYCDNVMQVKTVHIFYTKLKCRLEYRRSLTCRDLFPWHNITWFSTSAGTHLPKHPWICLTFGSHNEGAKSPYLPPKWHKRKITNPNMMYSQWRNNAVFLIQYCMTMYYIMGDHSIHQVQHSLRIFCNHKYV